MTWVEMTENTGGSISNRMKIWKYLQHGFALGVILVGFLLIALFFPYLVFPVLFLLGFPMMTAVFFGVIFMLLGGLNQMMAQHLWGIEVEQSIGTGMRDGFFLFVLLYISFAPFILVFQSMWQWWLWTSHAVNPLDVLVVLSISAPIYLLVMGFIGEKVAIFLHVEKEPERPPDFLQYTHACPHCGKFYYYGSEKIIEGQIQCQNCGKKFPVISDI